MRSASLACGVLLCAACGGRMAAPLPQPAPSPPPAPVQAAHAVRQIQTCVMENGRLRAVEATYDPASDDLLVDGRPLRELFTDLSGYAAEQPWFVNNEPITWERRYYTRYGPPRIVPPSQLRPGGEHGGVPFFVEANAGADPELLFVPTRPGCEFQWYQWEGTVGGVRG